MFVLLLSTWREHAEQRAGVTAASERRPMADAALAEMGGGTWRLGEQRGEVVLMNFWATWCGPCREETPMLERLARELGPRGFSVVGVSLDSGDREAKVREFREQYGVTYALVFPDAMSEMSAGMEGIPTTILVDRQGRVAKTYVGEVGERVLRADVGVLLGER